MPTASPKKRRKRWVWISVAAVLFLGFVRVMACRQEKQCEEVMPLLRAAVERGDRVQIRQELNRADEVCGTTLHAQERAQIAETIAPAERAEAARRAQVEREAKLAQEAEEAARRFPDERAQLTADLDELERVTKARAFDVADAAGVRNLLASKLAPLRRSALASSPEVMTLLGRVDAVSKRIDEAEAKERAELAALVERCGEELRLGYLEAYVETHLRTVLHDPDSLQDLDCSAPAIPRDRCWETTCTLRAKNAFGALILQRYRFYPSRGGVAHERLRF